MSLNELKQILEELKNEFTVSSYGKNQIKAILDRFYMKKLEEKMAERENKK